MHEYTFQTNLQEHKMCNKRRSGIAIHVQTYVQSTTLGPDQKLKKMVIFANFVSTHTSNVVKTLNLEICGLQYIGAESVVHDILTTSRTGLVPRPRPAESVVHNILTTSRTTGLVPRPRPAESVVHDILTTSRTTGFVPRPRPAESVVHGILTTSRIGPVPRASSAIWEKAVVFGVFMTVVPSQQAIDNRRYAFMSLRHTNRCHTTIFRGKTDDLMAYVPVC